MLAAAQAADTGAGVLFVVKNYSGDVMNFEMAAEMCDARNAMVLVNDDVAVENSSTRPEARRRRDVIVEKVVGSLAEAGAILRSARRSAIGSPSARRRWASPLRAASCPPPARRPFGSATTKWKSASASTANRATQGEARVRRRDQQ
jgi:dihydroxyacetone kinase-like protein